MNENGATPAPTPLPGASAYGTRLAEIDARAEAATATPWEVRGDFGEAPAVWHDAEVTFPVGRCADCKVEAAYEPEDAEFIANARRDVPDLAAALRAVLALCAADDGWDSTGLHVTKAALRREINKALTPRA